MRYYLDTEFIENGHSQPIQLLSIGIVAEDGREFYAELDDADETYASDWVKENVLPHLTGLKSSREQVAQDILQFVAGDHSPEFWAYFADYDWVVFCQIFGAMIDLPKGFPMFCNDLKQEMKARGVERSDLPEQLGAAHSALEDARWVRRAHSFLEENAGS